MMTILLTMMKCRKKLLKQKRVCKQRAFLVSLRNSGKLRWFHMSMSGFAIA